MQKSANCRVDGSSPHPGGPCSIGRDGNLRGHRRGRFIGSHLCERFLAEGHQVLCVDNLITGRRRNIEHLRDNAELRVLATRHLEPLDVDGPVDIVFTSPARPARSTTCDTRSRRSRSARWAPTTRSGVAKAKGARFLLAITSEVYGDPGVHPQRRTIGATSTRSAPRGVYDEAKRFAEAMTMAYHREHGVNTSIVRIFNTYGPRMRLDDGRVLPNFMRPGAAGRAADRLRRRQPDPQLLLRHDLVDGIVRSADSDAHYRSTSATRTSSRCWNSRRRSRGVGSRSEIVYEPLPHDDPKQRRPDISRARDLLGWQPEIDLHEGLRRTIEQAGVERLVGASD